MIEQQRCKGFHNDVTIKVSVLDTNLAGTCRKLRFQGHTALCTHEDRVQGVSDCMVP